MSKPPRRNLVRLQKFLCDAGVAARRDAEELITGGHVLVNGALVDTVPAFVDPRTDRVQVDGAPVRPAATLHYALNKPRGVACGETTQGRSPRSRRATAAGRSVFDLLPPAPARLRIAGRLADNSSGLVIVTSDGALAARIDHPRGGVRKVYRVELKSGAPDDVCPRLLAGVRLSDVRIQADAARIVHRGREGAVLEIAICDRQDRDVLRLVSAVGLRIRRLRRIMIGPVSLRGLAVGQWRPLTAAELARLSKGDRALMGAPRSMGDPNSMGDRAPGRSPAGSRRSSRSARPRPSGSRPAPGRKPASGSGAKTSVPRQRERDAPRRRVIE